MMSGPSSVGVATCVAPSALVLISTVLRDCSQNDQAKARTLVPKDGPKCIDSPRELPLMEEYVVSSSVIHPPLLNLR